MPAGVLEQYYNAAFAAFKSVCLPEVSAVIITLSAVPTPCTQPSMCGA